MIELFTDAMRRDPFALYAQLRAASPAFKVPGTDIWMLLDYVGAKAALIDPTAFSSAVELPTGRVPDWMIFNDPPQHGSLRALVLRAFTPRAIAAIEPTVQALADELLSAALAKPSFDLMAEVAGPLPARVIAKLLGIPPADYDRYLGWAETILRLGHTLTESDAAREAIAANAAVKDEMRAYLADVLDARRRAPQDDLLSRLLAAEIDGDRLSDEALLGFFQLLILAGIETTTNAIGNAVVCLLDHPSQLAKVRADPDRLAGAVEEMLRFRSPVQFAFRQARRDMVVGGQRLAAGELVLPMIGAANRDPAVFDEPDRFDIDRRPNPHLGFGHGIHFCLGAALARLETQVVLSMLLERAPALAYAEAVPWTPNPGLNVHGPSRLMLSTLTTSVTTRGARRLQFA